MSGMSDGVNSVFTVEHKRGAMHIQGFKNQRALISLLLTSTPIEEGIDDRLHWLASLHALIDASILRIKQEYEIDGHKLSEEELEARRG